MAYTRRKRTTTTYRKPYKKRYSKRNARFTHSLVQSKAPMRGVYGIGKQFTDLVGSKGGFPQKVQFSMTGGIVRTIGTAVATNILSHSILCGSPELGDTTAAFQPRYWDQYGLIYVHYWITHCKIIMKFSNLSATAAQAPAIITNLKPRDEPVLGTVVAVARRTALELHDKALYDIAPLGMPGDQLTIERMVNIKQVLARPRSRSQGEGIFGGAAAIHSNADVEYEIYIHPADGTTAFAAANQVRLRILVTWYGYAYDLKNIGVS